MAGIRLTRGDGPVRRHVWLAAGCGGAGTSGELSPSLRAAAGAGGDQPQPDSDGAVALPRPQDMEPGTRPIDSHGLPRVFWIYLAGAALVAAGFADYPLIAFHFQQAGTVPGDWVAIFYSIAMAVSGTGSLVLGRLFDRWGFRVLIVLTIVGAGFAPLVFLGGFWVAMVGAAIWGIGMGVHESIIPAAVSPMVPAERRASAFGVFTAGYGVAWFAGSAIIGILYDISVPALVAFCVAAAFAAVPIFIAVQRMQSQSGTP
jgi:predicted MFS family arabinose efflux permease